MTADAIVLASARRIAAAFADYNAEFRDITRRAALRFETRDWHGTQKDAVERIELYDRAVDHTVLQLRNFLGEQVLDRPLWRAIRDRYADDIAGYADAAFDRTFFSSVSRRLLGTIGSANDIEFKDGNFSVKGTDKTIDFPSVALQAYIAHKFSGQDLEPGLKESAFWDPTNFTFPAGVHVCEVEIDPETGKTRIDRWTAVDDFGKVINPMIVEGQVHGGIAQGVGQALCEGAVYDKDGQLITASFMDYCMPRADDLPSYHVGMTETACPSNPLGIKGCGEAGAIAAPPAVINAITNAVGHEDVVMPATAQTVWRAAQRAVTRKAAE